jgi:hypothetical protein
MGTVTPLPGGEIRDDFLEAETSITGLLLRVPIGSVALLDTEFSFPRGEQKPAKATFIDSSDLSLGRDEGRHQPRFGQMLLNGRGLHERPVLVTAKPFDDGLDTQSGGLAHEWSANNYLNGVGDRQLAYLPLGVWRNAEGVDHLLTLYEHDVISYDNVFWADRNVNPEALRAQVVEHAFTDCVRGLGYLHGAGLIHRDAEAKNLAANFNGVRFIDLEDARMLPRKGSKIEDSELTVRLIRNDIETFFDSTVQVDENRPVIASALSRSRMADKLAQTYRAGIKQARKESGVSMPSIPTTTSAYFRDTINHTLTVAAQTSASSDYEQ